MIKYLHKPRTCHLQWHVTEKCNFRCKHCYLNDDYIKNELNTQQCFYLLDNWVEFIKKTELGFAKISLSGGEPILKTDFFKILERINQYKQQGLIHNICVMSNGSTLSDQILDRYKQVGVDNIQISVEGTEQKNDEIRGKGNFQKALQGAKRTVAHGIPLSFSMTVTRQNIEDIEPLARLAAQIGVSGMGIGRLVPEGRGKKMQELMLNPREVYQVYKKLEDINQRFAQEGIGLKVGLHCSDALYTTINPNFKTHGCSTPYDVFTALPNGDIVPCRRLPITAGNILKNTFLEIYYASPVYQKLKNLENLHPSCKGCRFVRSCNGAGKCLAHGWFGTPYAPDPQCWHVFEKLTHKDMEERDSDMVKYNVFYVDNANPNLEPVNQEEVNKQKIEVDVSSDSLPEIPDNSHIYFKLSEDSLNPETGNKILNFLSELQKKGTNFRVVKPLPPCLFESNYPEILARFNIPQSCSQCLNLFQLEGNRIKLCNGKRGPELKYMNNRDQIAEFFKLVRKKSSNLPQKCQNCPHQQNDECPVVYCLGKNA